MGILLKPTWWEDAADVSPPPQWQHVTQAVTVQFSTTEAAIFTGTTALPANTPVTLTAATLPGGFLATTTYYVIPLLGIGPYAFALSTTAGGKPLSATSAGVSVVAVDQRFYFTPDLGADSFTSLLLHGDGLNGGTTFVDSSTYAHTMTAYGSANTSTTIPKFGTASIDVYNGGAADVAAVSAPYGTEFDLTASDWCLEAFVYHPTNGRQTGYIFFFPSAVASGLSLEMHYVGGNTISAQMRNTSNTQMFSLTTSALLANTWYHVALSRQGNLIKMFLNGVQTSSSDVTGFGTMAATINPVYVGGNNTSGNNFDGRIDEARISKGAARYTGAFTPPTAPFQGNDLPYTSHIAYIGNTVAGLQNGLFGTVRLGYQVIAQTTSPSLNLIYNIGAGNVTTVIPNVTGTTGVISICLDGATQFDFGIANPSVGASVAIGEAIGDTTYGNVNFNCSCVTPSTFESLLALRNRMLIRLGFASQVNNPPPGMAVFLNDCLISAQRLLWRKYPALFTRRLFMWPMQAGDRFYGALGNTDDVYQNFRADFSKSIEWSGIFDSKNTWTPIFEGIPPELYTMATQQGRPLRYEVRNCIEVFPAPDTTYTLVIKAHMTLLPFASDNDVTTIDSEVVFLHALAVAKAHYGQVDATIVESLAKDYLGELVASTHLNNRYIPGALPVMPMVQPRLLTFSDGTS